VEAGLDAEWEAAGHYGAASESDREPYCIVIPPPNVTGMLHMGHALTLTIQDILIRWQRMRGKNTLWLPGTDHAGIATQMVVERELAEEGLSRFDLGRERFLERAFDWKERYHDRIVTQMRRLGVSVDWSRERFTLDKGYYHAVRQVFVSLYEEGLVYRDHRLVNWSPGIRTVLSDLEIDHKEVKGKLWEIHYPVADEPGRRVTVATTRPETMLGDTAVAVHPDDPRHRDLIGREVELPLTGRTIPVIGDAEAVDLEFGTGAVKVTPAHDPNDFETGKRHGLPMLAIFDEAACCNENVPEAYRGLDRFEARERVLEDLDAQGLLGEIKEHAHAVGHCMRTGVVVEPMLSTQWFVRIEPLAREAIAAVKDGRIRFVPESWNKTYFNWMENIRDWCISRQLWWGHRIPVWTCGDCGELTCATEDPSECASCGSTALEQEEDVLDTWFSSGLWPFATLGWPEKTKELETFYPNTVMETGFDIIFFWVARMIMMGLKFMGEVPFKEVYFHAMVRDPHGEKMSKTKGNVIDPIDVTEEHGADALRFTLATLTAQGRDIKLSASRVEGYRTFCNKIWNAVRFVHMHLSDLDEEGLEQGRAHGGGTAERWIRAKAAEVSQTIDTALREYRFNEAASQAYQFVWHTFCDWYVELAKQTLRNEEQEPAVRRATQAALVDVTDLILRLLHPFMPHITERLWQTLPAFARYPSDMLIVASWPACDKAPAPDEGAVAAQEHVNDVVSAVRNIRSERGIAPSARVSLRLGAPDAGALKALEQGRDHIEALCRTGSLEIHPNPTDEPPQGASLALVGDTQVLLQPPEDEAGLAAERARLDKALTKVLDRVTYLKRKLANPKFVERAPEAVVDKEREALSVAEEELARYQTRREELG
jgi:valyl-tRNA synthetase